MYSVRRVGAVTSVVCLEGVMGVKSLRLVVGVVLGEGRDDADADGFFVVDVDEGGFVEASSFASSATSEHRIAF